MNEKKKKNTKRMEGKEKPALWISIFGAFLGLDTGRILDINTIMLIYVYFGYNLSKQIYFRWKNKWFDCTWGIIWGAVYKSIKMRCCGCALKVSTILATALIVLHIATFVSMIISWTFHILWHFRTFGKCWPGLEETPSHYIYVPL